jgi:hypothetical protein
VRPRPAPRERLYRITTGALVTIAIEFGVAILLFIGAVLIAQLVMFLAS